MLEVEHVPRVEHFDLFYLSLAMHLCCYLSRICTRHTEFFSCKNLPCLLLLLKCQSIKGEFKKCWFNWHIGQIHPWHVTPLKFSEGDSSVSMASIPLKTTSRKSTSALHYRIPASWDWNGWAWTNLDLWICPQACRKSITI